MTSSRSRTRLSLFYLGSYLGATGVALLLAPEFTLTLMGARKTYDPVFIRFSGAFMMALSAIVFQMVRHRVESLYPTTIGIRAFFIVCIVWFYRMTSDPVFLVFLAVVGLGFVLTATCLILDSRTV